MAVFTGILYTDPPVDLAKLANDGRITLVSATEIKWDGSVIGLSDGTNWKVCKPSSIPTAANTATDLNGTALAVDKIYDVFLNYSSVTSAALAFSRWAAHTAGSSSRNAAYAAGTPYIIGDRVTYSGRDYTCIQAGTGKTPTSEPTYWVDNGTSVSGDFAGLYRHDGVLVSHNSDTGKKLRWLGVIYTYSNSGTVNFKDEDQYRYISNYYNTKSKLCVVSFSLPTSWTYSSDTPREYNGGSGVSKGYCVISKGQTCLVSISGLCQSSGSGASRIWNSIDSTSSMAGFFVANKTSNLDYRFGSKATTITAGYHYVTLLERSDAGTATFYGDNTSCQIAIEV